MKKYFCLLLGITLVASSPLYGMGTEDQENSLKKLEWLSTLRWTDYPYISAKNDDFLAVYQDQLPEKFNVFEGRLNELGAFEYPVIILEGKADFLFPLLYLLRQKMPFRYFGIALGNFDITSNGMTKFNCYCEKEFMSFHQIKEEIIEQNDELNDANGPIIIGIEHGEKIKDSDTAPLLTINDYRHRNIKIHRQVEILADVLGLYEPTKIIFISRFLKPSDPLVSNNQEILNQLYSSEKWQEKTNPQDITTDSSYYCIAKLRSCNLNVIPYSSYASMEEKNKEEEEIMNVKAESVADAIMQNVSIIFVDDPNRVIENAKAALN